MTKLRLFEPMYPAPTARERRKRALRLGGRCVLALFAGYGAWIAGPHAADGLIGLAGGAGYVVAAFAGQ